jgi:hypothetical protein
VTQQTSDHSETTRIGNGRSTQESATENHIHQIPRAQEDVQSWRRNPSVEQEQFPSRVRGMQMQSEMEFMGYQTIVYVIFLMSAVVLIVADYGISDDCQNLKRFNTVFFVTAGSGFFIMMWTVLFRSLNPDCFVTSCSCFPLLLVNLMLLAMCITLGAGELFNPACGEGWARGWLTMYWVSFVFIFPLIPLVVRWINGCYLYWYHLLVMQVVYITHAMDVWIRGEDNVIPEYIPALTWFFIGSSAWVSTMYLTTYKYLAYLWVILGFSLVFWSAEPVWRLGGPHGLEAQILLVVFNLIVTYILCFRLWEALSPLVRKDLVKLRTTDSEDEVKKTRLNLRATFTSLFERSSSDSRPTIAVKSRGKVWNSGWTLVNNKDDGEMEYAGRENNRRDSAGANSEDNSAFEVETQILSYYAGSSDDEVRILIQESDEAPSPPPPSTKPVKQLHTIAESREKSQQQELLESNPLLSQKVETTVPSQASLPLSRSIDSGAIEKDIEESKNVEKSFEHENKVDFAQQVKGAATQSQGQIAIEPDGEKNLNKALRHKNGQVSETMPLNTV